MATDLAEFVGAAIALNLLFGVPLFEAGIITARRLLRGARAPAPRAPPLRARHRRDARGRPAGLPLRHAADRLRRRRGREGAVPGFEGTDSVLLATGILGATVMPHVIYLHSALTQRRIATTTTEEKRAPAALPARRRHDRDGARRAGEHGDAHRRRVAVPRERPDQRRHHRGGAQGLRDPRRPRRRARLRARAARLGPRVAPASARWPVRSSCRVHRPDDPDGPAAPVTMLPALVVLAIGVNPTEALVLSQVVLSFGIPFALDPAPAAHATARHHGRPGQPAGHDGRREHRRGAHHRAEPLPAGPHDP